MIFEKNNLNDYSFVIFYIINQDLIRQKDIFIQKDRFGHKDTFGHKDIFGHVEDEEEEGQLTQV